MEQSVGRTLLKTRKSRIWEIDFLRGLCIILMIFDHMMFDFMNVQMMAFNFYSVDSVFFEQMAELAEFYWYDWIIRLVVRNLVVFFFLFMSGISCSLTKSNARRLRKLAVGAALVSIVTLSIDAAADVGLSIVFGILHMITFSLLVYMLIKKIFPNPYFYLTAGAIIIMMGFFLPVGNGTTAPFWEIGLTNRDWIYTLDWDGFLKVLAGTHLYGSDSYGVFPYLGFFLIGAAFGEIVYAKKQSLLKGLDGAWNKAYSFIGRHGIAFYLAHQLLVFLLVTLSAMSVGYEFF